MDLLALQNACAKKQQRGLHFIIASVIIWMILLAIQSRGLPILTTYFLTFCSTALLIPLAYVISRLLKIDFKNEGNPLTRLGMILSMNQILYLLIAIWAYSAVPDKMLMILAIIFGAHLLPFSWLYRSKAYLSFSILIPIAALIIGDYSAHLHWLALW